MNTPPKSAYEVLSVEDEIAARHEDFMEAFGSEGFFEDTLVTCLHRIEQICSVYFGTDSARAGLDTMVGRYFPELVKTGGWKHALEEEFSGIYSELPVGHLFHDLDAYANYGIFLRSVPDPAERERVLGEMVEAGKTFIEVIPLKAWGIANEHAVWIVRKASIRFKLDSGEPINAEELALISGLELQSIRNKLAGKTKEIQGNQAKILAADALNWLRYRKDFLPSLWREQDDSDYVAAFDDALTGCLFVPVAKDGTVFSPSVSQDGAFIIGPEGHERRMVDYSEALAALQAMQIPIWRRPTEGGTWTRVRGVSWTRMKPEDFSHPVSCAGTNARPRDPQA